MKKHWIEYKCPVLLTRKERMIEAKSSQEAIERLSKLLGHAPFAWVIKHVDIDIDCPIGELGLDGM